jgi:uncharacterized membrane-anchored protein
MDKCSSDNGKYTASGNAVFTVLYRNDGEVYSSDVNVPVKYERDGSVQTVAAFDAVAECEEMKLRIADGNLCIDAELRIGMDCMGEQSVEVVDRVSLGETLERRDSELIVCYPATDDTLWSVAKRYNVAPTAVSGDPASDKYVLIG